MYINTDREVVVLFSEYETFEIRTLEAYEEVYDLLDSARIDRSIRFLISGDHRVESIIRHYLDQHPEYPIIIPETFSGVAAGGRNILQSAVRRNYLLRDLFGYQNPLREETFFFGRQSIVNSVLDMAKSGQNSSLFGLRKSGKTSVIYAIQRKAKSFSCNVIMIDCQSPAVHARNYSELLSYIISEVRRILAQKKISINLGHDPASVADNFNIHMRNVISNTKNNTLILFDEIENISPGTAASEHWNKGNDPLLFWQIIRSFVQSDTQGKLSICIVGTSPHLLESPRINGIANPIYLFAQKWFIPNLTFSESGEMIERLGYFMGLEFSKEIIADLQKYFGGHPFFTRQVCSKIHQAAPSNRPVKVSQAMLAQAKAEFSGELEIYLRDILQHLSSNYPYEFSILRAVFYGNKDELNEFARDAPDLIDHLIGYGLVAKIGSDCDIKFEAVKHAIGNIIDNHSLESKWKELVIRRNQIESDIRVTIYQWSKMISPDDWRHYLEKNLTSVRFSALSSIEPSIICARHSSPLYITDLMALLKDSSFLPYLGDRRSNILKKLNVINSMRKDAHANYIDDREMEGVREAFDYLDVEFGMP